MHEACWVNWVALIGERSTLFQRGKSSTFIIYNMHQSVGRSTVMLCVVITTHHRIIELLPLARQKCVAFDLVLFFSDIDVNLVSADITALESDGVAQVCVIVTNGILAIDVEVLLTTDDNSAIGIYSCY